MKLPVLLLILGSFCASACAAMTSTRPVILVTAQTETDTTTSAGGAATRVGGVVIAGGGADSSTYEHSVVWEVVRRLTSECPSATYVVNPATPHTLTIHVDYFTRGHLLGTPLVFYQLVLLDDSNPVFISKQAYLRQTIKPTCKAIKQRQR